MKTVMREPWRRTALALLAATLAWPAWSAPPEQNPRERSAERAAPLAEGRDRGGRADRGDRAERGDRGDRPDRGDRGSRGDDARDRGNRGDRDGGNRGDRDGSNRGDRTPRPPNRDWWDGAHGHNHRYPAPGVVIRTPPRTWNHIYWGGIGYRYHDGIWYSPGVSGYVVVRPPFGVVVHDLPAFRTLLTIGGIAYLYANGVYYRERAEGGYEVVPPPVATPDAPPPDRQFVYPRQGQSPQQQASDEYECHRWAVSNSGFDPTNVATGQTIVDPARRTDYQRARAACLEGRGYTVR